MKKVLVRIGIAGLAVFLVLLGLGIGGRLIYEIKKHRAQHSNTIP